MLQHHHHFNASHSASSRTMWVSIYTNSRKKKKKRSHNTHTHNPMSKLPKIVFPTSKGVGIFHHHPKWYWKNVFMCETRKRFYKHAFADFTRSEVFHLCWFKGWFSADSDIKLGWIFTVNRFAWFSRRSLSGWHNGRRASPTIVGIVDGSQSAANHRSSYGPRARGGHHRTRNEYSRPATVTTKGDNGTWP